MGSYASLSHLPCQMARQTLACRLKACFVKAAQQQHAAHHHRLSTDAPRHAPGAAMACAPQGERCCAKCCPGKSCNFPDGQSLSLRSCTATSCCPWRMLMPACKALQADAASPLVMAGHTKQMKAACRQCLAAPCRPCLTCVASSPPATRLVPARPT